MCIFKYDWKTVSRTFAQCLSKDESEMVFHLRSVEVCALQTKNAKASLACSISFEFVNKLTNSSPCQVGFAIIGKYFHSTSGCKTEIGLMCPICFLCMVSLKIWLLNKFLCRFRISKRRNAVWNVARRNLSPSPCFPQQNSPRQLFSTWLRQFSTKTHFYFFGQT